jgi:endonuclease/exonuclease/phosphatase (EEP) superfamily protein YafD
VLRRYLIYAAVIGFKGGEAVNGPSQQQRRWPEAQREQSVTSTDEEDDDDISVWPFLVGTGLTLAILLVLLGFLGWLHPMGDSLAVGRSLAVGAVLVLAIAASMLGMRVAAFWSILFALLAGAPVFLATLLPGPSGALVLYQKNLRFDNAELAAVEADIRQSGAVALTLQEVSEPNKALLAALADRFPHQQVCTFGPAGGVAVATALPPVPGAVVCAPGLAAMQVMVPDSQGQTPVWIVSVHLHWPWPNDQQKQVAGLLPVLEGLEGSVVMAGDFNMVRWAHSVRQMAAAARAVPAGPSNGTFLGFAPVLRLPIDHVFSSAGGRLDLRPALGSDHLGLLARLGV